MPIPEAGLPNFAVAERASDAAALITSQSDADAAAPASAPTLPTWLKWLAGGIVAYTAWRMFTDRRALGWDPNPIPMSPHDRAIVGAPDLTPAQMDEAYESLRRTNPEETSFSTPELKGRYAVLHPSWLAKQERRMLGGARRVRRGARRSRR